MLHIQMIVCARGIEKMSMSELDRSSIVVIIYAVYGIKHMYICTGMHELLHIGI